MGWYSDDNWRPYVSVAERRRQAAKKLAKMKKAGRRVSPVAIAGRKIATTFWGIAWCKNLESYSDYSNRLPRGRTYARNGSVIDLQIEAGLVHSLVSGQDLYEVDIEIKPIAKRRWTGIKRKCAGQIDSLVELLQGSISKAVMEIVTRQAEGLYSFTPRDRALLLVPRLGDHVQARGSDALRSWCAPRPRAGAAVHVASRRPGRDGGGRYRPASVGRRVSERQVCSNPAGCPRSSASTSIWAASLMMSLHRRPRRSL